MKKGVIILFFVLVFVLISFVSSATYNTTEGTTTIYECGTIVEPGTYTLNQSITNQTYTCIIINTNSVVLEGGGFTLTGAGKDNSNIRGISNQNSNLHSSVNDARSNLTIKNFGNITNYSDAIRFVYTDNSSVFNNSLDSSYYGIELTSGSDNNIIRDNSFIKNYVGIYMHSSDNNQVYNNTVFLSTGYGIFTQGSDNNTYISNNISSNNFTGIYLEQSDYNTIQNNNISLNLDSGIRLSLSSNNLMQNNNITYDNLTSHNSSTIYLIGSSNNQIIGGIISNSKESAIKVEEIGSNDFPSNNNTFINITIINTDSSFYDFDFIDSSAIETYIIDMRITNYYINETIISFEDSTYGQIRFLEAINGSGTNLSNDIRIGNNSVVVESASNNGLNKSANITLYGIGDRGFNAPIILKDAQQCFDCYNFTSLIANNIIFNVTSFSNYSIGSDAFSPSITDISSSVTSATATITWVTGELTNSTVYYGTTTNTTSNKGSSSLATSHSTTLTSLSASTTYYYNVSNCDSPGNCDTSIQYTFTTSATPVTPSNGGGGGGIAVITFWSNTYVVTDENFEVGFEKELINKQRVKLSVGGESHYVGVVGLTSTHATINISSDTVQVVLVVGDDVKVDLLDDGFYDIYVKLNNIFGGKANLTIESIHEEIPE